MICFWSCHNESPPFLFSISWNGMKQKNNCIKYKYVSTLDILERKIESTLTFLAGCFAPLLRALASALVLQPFWKAVFMSIQQAVSPSAYVSLIKSRTNWTVIHHFFNDTDTLFWLRPVQYYLCSTKTGIADKSVNTVAKGKAPPYTIVSISFS